MNIFATLEMAVKTLTANKLRSLLTMLGIIIGNASVIAVFAIGEGAKEFTQKQLESIGPNQLSIWAQDTVENTTNEVAEIVLADVEAIQRQAPAVVKVAPQISGNNMQISHRGRSIKNNIIGTTSGILFVRNLNLRKGRFFDTIEQQQSAQVTVLGSNIVKKLFGKQNPLGKDVQINNANFKVIGIMQPKGSFLGNNYDDAIYIPITTVAERLIAKRSPRGITIDFFEVSAKNKQNIRAAAFQVTNILTRRHGKNNFSISANKSLQDMVENITGGLSLVLTTIASISLLVGGVGIMNIMLVSVTERTKEIGLRKAIGATETAILSQFLIESIILSVGGGLIGTGIGIGGSFLVGLIAPIQPTIPIMAIVFAAGVSGGIGLVFGVAPARQAARLDPINALRNS